MTFHSRRANEINKGVGRSSFYYSFFGLIGCAIHTQPASTHTHTQGKRMWVLLCWRLCRVARSQEMLGRCASANFRWTTLSTHSPPFFIFVFPDLYACELGAGTRRPNPIKHFLSLSTQMTVIGWCSRKSMNRIASSTPLHNHQLLFLKKKGTTQLLGRLCIGGRSLLLKWLSKSSADTHTFV